MKVCNHSCAPGPGTFPEPSPKPLWWSGGPCMMRPSETLKLASRPSPRCTPAARGCLLCLGKPAALYLVPLTPEPPGWNALLQMTTGVHFLTAFASAPLGRLHEGSADHTAPWSPRTFHCAFALHPFSFSISCVTFYNTTCSCLRFLTASLPVLD